MNELSMQRATRRLERGQSLIEMSVGFVILILLVSGLLDLGRVYFIFVALEDGAGEAALYLAINPSCRTEADGAAFTPNPCLNPNNVDFRARNAGGDLVDWTTADVQIVRPVVYGVGDPVRVTLSYDFGLLTPIIPQIAGLNPLTLTVTATQTIIAE